MNKKINKKGFTIVELVVVIVVIAILAAVLIPTYKGLVDKANVSADEQAVRQMNTILAMHDSDNTIKTVADAVTVLRAENIELEDYKALSKNHYFYFVLDNNENGRIILAEISGARGADPPYPQPCRADGRHLRPHHHPLPEKPLGQLQ